VLALEVAAGFGLFHSLFNWRSYRSCGSCLLDLLGYGSKKRARRDYGTALRELVHSLRWIFSGFAAGSIGGLLYYALLTGIHRVVAHSPDCHCMSGVIVLGPSLFLMAVVLAGFVLVGVQGRLLSEAQREWWSSLGGWILMYAAGWAAVFGTVLYGPYLLMKAEDSWSRVPIVVGWIVSVGGGLFTAHSSQTGAAVARSRPNWFRDLVVGIAPPLFLIGMLILSALCCFALIHGHWPENGEDYLKNLNDSENLPKIARMVPILLLAAYLAGRLIDINVFSLQGTYCNRLVRCYLGASRRKSPEDSERSPGAAMNSHGPLRRPNVLTGFDPRDDMPLSSLQIGQPPATPRPPDLSGTPEKDNQERPYQGPLLIVNTTLNLVQGEELAWQERKAESFALTPRFCGSLTTGYRDSGGYGGGLSLGTAVGISGAAVSPNMGFHSAPAVTALLTVFNARLGAWLGNPRHRTKWDDSGPSSGLVYLLNEMFGRTNAHKPYVYLSDGGHFDNLGVYELVRRRCRFIVVCDAGADPLFDFDDLGSLIRKVRIDLGVRIDISIDVSGLKPGPDGRATAHVAFGKICYSDVDADDACDDKPDPWVLGEREGLLVYIKPVLTGDEPTDVANYAAEHPHFPHDSTANQFFAESQFESYRALGYHSAKELFRDVVRYGHTAADAPPNGPPPSGPPAPQTTKPPDPRSNRDLFFALLTTLCPPPPDFNRNNLELNKEYIAIQQVLRDRTELRGLSAEIYSALPENDEYLKGPGRNRGPEIRAAERHMVAQMFTVLENTWFALHLKRYREHPVHNGWKEVMNRWFRAPTVRDNWKVLKGEFSHQFQEFVDRYEFRE